MIRRRDNISKNKLELQVLQTGATNLSAKKNVVKIKKEMKLSLCAIAV